MLFRGRQGAALGYMSQLTGAGHRTVMQFLLLGRQRDTYYPSQLKKIEAHIRRRLRSKLVDQQKSKRNLFKKLITRGVSRRQTANAVFSNNKRWALSNTFAVTRAYPNVKGQLPGPLQRVAMTTDLVILNYFSTGLL